jgi:hypothetical protein
LVRQIAAFVAQYGPRAVGVQAAHAEDHTTRSRETPMPPCSKPRGALHMGHETIYSLYDA